MLQRLLAWEDIFYTWDMTIGYMIPIYSNIGQGMRHHFEKLVSWHGKNELIPVFLENNILNFYLNREVQSTETNNVNNAKQSGNEYGRPMRS